MRLLAEILDGFLDLDMVIAGIVLALLVGGAGWALYAGLAMRGRATADARDAARLSIMLASSPAQLMLVHEDGRLDMPLRLATWLGLDQVTDDLAGISTLAGDDVSRLAANIAACRDGGRGFQQAVVPIGGASALMLVGARAPDALHTSRGVLVAAFDASSSEARIAALDADRRELAAAFDAVTGLIEAAPMPMWYRGSDLRLTMVNAAYVDAVEGADAADAVGRGLELVEASTAGGPLVGAAAAREAGQPQYRTVPVTIDGARRSMCVTDVPLAGGGVAGYAVDVEEQEQAAARLKRFADAQLATFDRLSAGVAQFSAERSLSFCNQPFRRMFAMRTEWLSDRPEFDRVLERMREANRLPEVRDFPRWKAERREWFGTADTGIEENWHLPGGTHIRVVAQALADGGLLLVFEDRTEQVQLASARDTLLRVRTATFDNLFEALGVFASDGRLQLWNTRFRALWGFEEEFLASHPRVNAFAEAAAAQLSNPSRASLIAELVRSATVERQQRGGRVAFADGRHFEFAAVPLPDGNALFTMLDITDSRRAEQALRDRAEALETADRVKTEFVANMSYELKTPLTSISGFAEMLHGGYAGRLPKLADGYVDAILESVERLSVLVDDALDLTRDDDEVTLELRDLDLAAVLRTAAATVEPQAKRRDIDFAIEVKRSAGRVRGDEQRLRESVEHLLRHAVEATAEGGRVLLHADGAAGNARIVVSDNGHGMDADTAERAFDRFATRTPGEGFGLGLPLAKQFVEAHGGTIALVSEPGEGTVVTIDLPRR